MCVGRVMSVHVENTTISFVESTSMVLNFNVLFILQILHFKTVNTDWMSNKTEETGKTKLPLAKI
jgi:hypothetical protein